MSISAVTVSFQTGPVLDQCLAALLAAPEIEEVILVDNGNPQEVEQGLDARAARSPRLRIVRGHGNVGFGAACNIGARAARGDQLLFINPDVALEPGAATRMSATLAEAREPVIVGGDLRDSAGQPDRGSRRGPVTLWSACVSFLGLSRLERVTPLFRDLHRHQDPIPAQATEIANVSGALMMMSRAGFERLSGFDEAYFLHAEDIDLCWRAGRAGGQILFQPGARGIHARSTSNASSRDVERHKARGLRRFFRKSARSPFERVAAELVGAVLLVVLPARAR